MSRLPLSLACGPYDRTRALASGAVEVEGVDLRYVALEPEEMFFRAARHEEFDVTELSLSTYLVSLSAGAPFVGLPIFPSRMFRHSGIYVHAGIDGDVVVDEPAQLRGARVGVAEYQLTANVWIRGILEERHGVPVESVRYVTGGLNRPGRVEKAALSLPPGVEVIAAPEGATLSGMLAEGHLDAIYSPRAPDCYLAGHPAVRRLFPDPRRVEADYYRQTGMFPIMHLLVVRRDLYEANRWLARSLTKAFESAKRICMEELSRTAALSASLPWLHDELAATRSLMGDDFWPYGVTPNRRVLEVFAGYSHRQGLSGRLFAPEELFAPETLDQVVI